MRGSFFFFFNSSFLRCPSVPSRMRLLLPVNPHTDVNECLSSPPLSSLLPAYFRPPLMILEDELICLTFYLRYRATALRGDEMRVLPICIPSIHALGLLHACV